MPQSDPPMTRRPLWRCWSTARRPVAWAALAGLLVVLLGLLAVAGPGQGSRTQASLLARLDQLQQATPAQQVDCARWRAQRPLVLLMLGQSNAGNHGLPTPGGSPTIRVMDAGRCALSADPLPGSTGRGGSIASLLPGQLAGLGLDRPVLIQLLAVDATTVDDWVRDDSPLRQHLLATLAANFAAGLPPDRVLWQQGEADALAHTPPAVYTARLLALADLLTNAGVRAPLVVALSTVCRTPPASAQRSAVGTLIAAHPGFLAGPDTDSIGERHDGCHLNATGRALAAAAWARALPGPWQPSGRG